MTRICLIGFFLALAALAGCDRPKPMGVDSKDATAPVVDADAAGQPLPAEGPRAGPGNLPLLALSGQGLDLVDPTSGAIRHLSFGLPFEEAIAILGRVQHAAASRSRNEDCGAGPVDFATWSDGLAALGQDGRFVGWRLDAGQSPGGPSSSATTVNGIGIGLERSELESIQVIEVTSGSLGTEFAAGDLYGLLASAAPDARITHLWAGVSCNFG